jgi:hypothetical protein
MTSHERKSLGLMLAAMTMTLDTDRGRPKCKSPWEDTFDCPGCDYEDMVEDMKMEAECYLDVCDFDEAARHLRELGL